MSGQCTCWRVSGKWVASGGGLPAVCSEPSPSSPLHSLPGRRGTPGIPIMFLCCLPVCYGNVAFTSPSPPPARLTAERDGPRCVSRADMRPSDPGKAAWRTGGASAPGCGKQSRAAGTPFPAPMRTEDRRRPCAVRPGPRPPPGAKHPGGARAKDRARCATASPRNATWLILPVVICLSQRLSHACVSMN